MKKLLNYNLKDFIGYSIALFSIFWIYFNVFIGIDGYRHIVNEDMGSHAKSLISLSSMFAIALFNILIFIFRENKNAPIYKLALTGTTILVLILILTPALGEYLTPHIALAAWLMLALEVLVFIYLAIKIISVTKERAEQLNQEK